MRKLLCLLILLPVIARSQTCIVAIKNKGIIYIGAESRIAFHGKELITQHEVERFDDTICKIIVGSKMGFAVTGYDGAKLKSIAMGIFNDTISFELFRIKYQTKTVPI